MLCLVTAQCYRVLEWSLWISCREVLSSWSNGDKLTLRRFPLNIRKHFFTVRVTGSGCPGGCWVSIVGDTQKLVLLEQEDWTTWPPEVTSNLRRSVMRRLEPVWFLNGRHNHCWKKSSWLNEKVILLSCRSEDWAVKMYLWSS